MHKEYCQQIQHGEKKTTIKESCVLIRHTLVIEMNFPMPFLPFLLFQRLSSCRLPDVAWVSWCPLWLGRPECASRPWWLGLSRAGTTSPWSPVSPRLCASSICCKTGFFKDTHAHLFMLYFAKSM